MQRKFRCNNKGIQLVSNSQNNIFSSLCVCLSEVAPYLRGGGAGQQVVLEGNRLVLTCLAGGSWPLQYRWTLNNSNISDWTQQYRSVSSGWQCVTVCRVSLLPFSKCASAYWSVVLSPESRICVIHSMDVDSKSWEWSQCGSASVSKEVFCQAWTEMRTQMQRISRTSTLYWIQILFEEWQTIGLWKNSLNISETWQE